LSYLTFCHSERSEESGGVDLEQAIEAIPTSSCHTERSEESGDFDLEQAVEAIPTNTLLIVPEVFVQFQAP
jgi:hypothetical protein